jgi:hypothetical protein
LAAYGSSGEGRCCRVSRRQVPHSVSRGPAGFFQRRKPLAETICILRGVRVRIVLRRISCTQVRVPLGPLSAIRIVVVLFTVIWVKVGSHSFGEPSKAHLMEERERPDRGKDSPFHYRLPVPVRKLQEFEQGMNMGRVDHAADANYPREYMDCPALVRIETECFLKRQVGLLLASCSKQLGRMYVRRTAEIDNSYPFVMMSHEDPVRLPPTPVFSSGLRGRAEYQACTRHPSLHKHGPFRS